MVVVLGDQGNAVETESYLECLERDPRFLVPRRETIDQTTLTEPRKAKVGRCVTFAKCESSLTLIAGGALEKDLCVS